MLHLHFCNIPEKLPRCLDDRKLLPLNLFYSYDWHKWSGNFIISHTLQEELKLNQGSTFRSNLYWHCFTASSEATAINTYWVYALRFTKCLFFFVLLILKQTIKPAGLFYLLLLSLSTKIIALTKNIGGFHMNIGLLKFSFLHSSSGGTFSHT